MTSKQDIESGAKHVEETEHMQAGLETPGDLAAGDSNMVSHVDGEHLTAGQSDTMLGEAVLAMLQQGNSVQVRVGSPTNTSELYEGRYESADEANTAMLDAGILKPEQVSDTNVVAGTGIHLRGLSSQQLQNAGLQRKSNSTM